MVCSVSRPALGAAPLPIELTWTGPADCQDHGEVEETIGDMLGSSRVSAQSSAIRAVVELRSEFDGGYTVKLTTETLERRGERELRASDCVDAQRAVALLLAIMLDPNAAHAAPEPRSAPATMTEPAPPPAPAPPPGRRRSGALAGLGGSVDLGTLPHFGYGAELRLGFFHPHGTFEVRGAAWLPRSMGSSSLPGAGGNFALLEGALIACVGLAAGGPWSLDGCAGPGLARMHATGFGMSEARAASALWAAGLAEVGVAVRASRRLSARLAIGGRVPFSRPTFAIEEVGPVHRPRELAGRAGLGLLMLF